MVDWGRFDVMESMLDGTNIGLATARSNKSEHCDHFLVSKYMTEAKFAERTTQSALFPLYIYSNSDMQYKESRVPNLKSEIIEIIVEKLDMNFVQEKTDEADTFCPTDLLDYIYAVLYSPTYRNTYKETLKSDYPRVPYPEDKNKFKLLVNLGRRLREFHLFEANGISNLVTNYPQAGSNIVESIVFKDNKVYINNLQYFEGILDEIWNMNIGGYQPAQKWLKDRKGHALNFEDILHYQKIIKVIVETQNIMNQIKNII